MDPLALVMFNRNQPEGVRRTVRQLDRLCSEVLVVDSSDDAGYRRLVEGIHSTKARILRSPPLGCTEPLRPFAHAALDSPWVLSVDTDEVVSSALEARLASLLTDVAAFRVPRTELSLGTTTWHTRVYRRDRIRYAGWIHEDPKVDGPVGWLAPGDRLLHEADYSDYLATGGRAASYLAIESYERPFTGRTLHEEFGESWATRLVGDGSAPLSRPRAALFLATWKFGRWTARGAGEKVRRARRYFSDYVTARYRHFYSLSEDDRVEAAEIADEIRAVGGPIPYLGLHDGHRVATLGTTVPSELPGGAVLREMLRHRHRTGRCLDEWPPASYRPASSSSDGAPHVPVPGSRRLN